MKKIADLILGSARMAVVLAACLALVISGAGAAERLFASQTSSETEKPTSDCAELSPGLGEEEVTDDMASGNRPWTEPAAYLAGLSISSLINSSDKQFQRDVGICRTVLSAALRREKSGAVSSPWLVIPSLGRQYTLVGAKPSGTG